MLTTERMFGVARALGDERASSPTGVTHVKRAIAKDRSTLQLVAATQALAVALRGFADALEVARVGEGRTRSTPRARVQRPRPIKRPPGESDPLVAARAREILRKRGYIRTDRA